MAERPPPFVTNERIRSPSRTSFQLGSALPVAAIANSYSAGGLSVETGGWFLIRAGII